MNEILTILNQQGTSLVGEIRSNLSRTGTTATGKTAQSMRLEVKSEQGKWIMRIFGRPFFFTVETGRRATPEKKPSRSMIENIKLWLQARGKEQGLVWAIAVSIQKKGTSLFRRGGREDIVTSVLTDSRLDQIARSILQQFVKDFQARIR